MIHTTREQRRQLERENERRPHRLVQVARDEWPDQFKDGPILRVWRSRWFLVQEYLAEAPATVRLSIHRTTLDPTTGRWVDGITWDELQAIKAQCGYGDADALEVYPAARDMVNVANIRHLWVMAEPVSFAWRRPAAPAAPPVA